MKTLAITAFFLVSLHGSGNAVAEDRWTQTYTSIASPTVAIRITWTEKEGEPPKVSHGTGFLISGQGHYITAAHIIPAGVDPGKLLIEAELRPFMQKRQGPVTLKLVGVPDRSALVDAAVLQDATRSIKAVPLVYDARVPSPPEQLMILGYSGESSSEMSLERVTGQGADESIRIDAFVKEGFSGSPVVDADGYVVGMVRGGDPVADLGPNSRVMGKALFTPVSRIANKMQALAGIRWTDVAASRAAPAAFATRPEFCMLGFCFGMPDIANVFGKKADRIQTNPAPPKAAPANLPIQSSRSIDRTKDDHPIVFAPSTETYPAVTVKAFDGYRITDAKFRSYSANGAHYDIQVAEDSTSASFVYSLTSGPLVDQYRGWLLGDFVVTMIPK